MNGGALAALGTLSAVFGVLLCAAPAGQAAERSPGIYAEEIVVEGAAVLPAERIAAIVEAYQGRELSFLELQQLRNDLTALYQDAGYVNSGFVIPDQPADAGRLRLAAVEGGLTRIEVTGGPRLRHAYLAGRIARHIRQPLQVDDIQYALRWLQMDGNVDRLDAELLPGDQAGESVLRLSVVEPERFEIMLGVDNHRSASLGAEAGRVTTVMRNLTGFGETTRLSVALSEGVDEYSASTSVPLNRWNTTVDAYYGEADSQIIEERFAALDIESRVETLGLSVTQPWIQRLDRSLTLSLGVENKTSREELLGVPFSFSPGAERGDAETTSLQLSADWTARSPSRVISVRGTYRHGIDWMGASKFAPGNDFEAQLNPTGADGDFQLLRIQSAAVFRLNALGERLAPLGALNDRARLLLRGSAQLSDDPLMSLEKLAIGGVDTVRGFRENTYVRDNGVALSVEMQLPVWGYRPEPHYRNLVVATFVDYGTSWDEENINPGSQSRDTSDRRYLASAGLGLLWQPLRGLRAELYWGEPIADDFEGDGPRDLQTRDYDLQDDGIHFSVTYAMSF